MGIWKTTRPGLTLPELRLDNKTTTGSFCFPSGKCRELGKYSARSRHGDQRLLSPAWTLSPLQTALRKPFCGGFLRPHCVADRRWWLVTNGRLLSWSGWWGHFNRRLRASVREGAPCLSERRTTDLKCKLVKLCFRGKSNALTAM